MVCGGGGGSGIERSLGCNALIYNDAVFLNVFATELRGEQWAEPVPPEPNRLMADIDATLVQQIFDISKRKWITHIHHYRQADDFGRRLEVLEWVAFCHLQKLNCHSARLKLVSSDRTSLSS